MKVFAHLKRTGFKAGLLCVPAVIAACGGGGGGSPSPTPTPSTTPTPVEGAYTKSDLAEFSADLLVDGYTELDTRFSDLQQATSAFCVDTSVSENFVALQETWLEAMSAWQYVQAINFGPANEDFIRFRISSYLSFSQSQLQESITSLISSTSDITVDSLAVSAAGIQGLPALEWVLFRSDAQIEFNTSSIRHCDYIEAVADNLKSMSEELVAGWQDGSDFRTLFTSDAEIEDSMEDLFGSLVEHLGIIEDSKLQSVLDGSTTSIESPHAQSSLDNIDANTQFYLDFYALDSEGGLSDLLNDNGGETIAADFEARLSALETVSADTSGAIVLLMTDTEGRAALEALTDAVHQVLEDLAVDVASQVDVFIGFNSTDGD